MENERLPDLVGFEPHSEFTSAQANLLVKHIQALEGRVAALEKYESARQGQPALGVVELPVSSAEVMPQPGESVPT